MRYLIRGEWVDCVDSQDYRNRLCNKTGATVFDVQVLRGLRHVVEHLFDSYDWPATTDFLTKLLENWPEQIEADEQAAVQWAQITLDLYPTSFFETLESLRSIQLEIARAKMDKQEVMGKMLKKLTKLQEEINKRKRNRAKHRGRR